MSEIPVTFSLAGKEIKGIISPVSGANGLWYIMSDGCFIGQLSNGSNGWQFASQKYGYDQQLADHFGYCISAWLDSHPE